MTEKVRIVTRNGGWFDFDRPPNLDMTMFVQAIRSAGYFLQPNVYIPIDWIAAIFTFSGVDTPAMTVMPNAPTTETKQ